MRKIFFNTLEEFAKKDKNIFLLVADLGIKFFESFRVIGGKRALNVGAAEANMIGVASGLSISGKNVYCYSITPFITMRVLEQIKVDVAFNNLNIKILGSGGGFAYGAEGMTHHSIEDIAIMRSIPNMTVVCPGDAKETKLLAKESVYHKGPLYVRFGRDFDPLIHKGNIDFKIGKGIVVNEGKDICIITTGTMLHGSTEAIRLLKNKGLNPTLISMHTVKPLDVDLIVKCSKKYKMIFTIEDHNIIGGLGSAVSEVLIEKGYNGRFKRIGVEDKYCSVAGKTDYLMKINKLDSENLNKTILKEYKEYKGT